MEVTSKVRGQVSQMKRLVVLCGVILLVLLPMAFVAACQQQPMPATPTPTPTREIIASQRLIVEIDVSSWIPESLKVSPDSKRVAYVAGVGNKWLVVVDGEEDKQYDGIRAEGGTIIFDSPNSLHYLARKGNCFYLVEQRID